MGLFATPSNFKLKEKRSVMKGFIYATLTLLLMGVCVVGCSKDSGQTVESLNNEAFGLVKSGQHRPALEKATAAFEKSEEENGHNHPNTIMSLEIMGVAYEAIGDSGSAEIAYLRALSVAKKFSGPASAEVAKLKNNLGGLYFAQNQYVLADSFFNQSLAILGSLNPDDPRLEIIRKNIGFCEERQNGGEADLAAGVPESVDEAAEASSQNLSAVKNPSVNLVQDLVPQEVKDAMISQFSGQNVVISDLDPRPPVLIERKGMVFPYHALKKAKNSDSFQEIVVLFAAIKNPEKPDALVFQQCRLITHSSYLEALEKGGTLQLKQELMEVFPALYL